jgi:hypothetical protein
LGSLEDYGRKVLFGGIKTLRKTNFVNPNDGFQFSLITGFDYSRFKLFLLSILWRATISTREMFQDAQIPDIDKENLRNMIISGNAGKDNEYPITFFSYLNDPTVAKDIIMQPIISKTNQRLIISFLLGGLIISFYVSSKYSMNDIKEYALTYESFNILYIPKGNGMNFILKCCNLI